MDTENLINYFQSVVLLLLPQKCYDEFFVKYNFSDARCLKIALSKGLGLALVAGSALVKVPQIVKICSNRSAEGLSFLSVLMDLYAVTSSVAYSYSQKFPFSAWGDSAFLLIQTVIITVLVLHYNYSRTSAAAFIAVFSAVMYALMGGILPLDFLWRLQAISAPIVFGGKMVQARANYVNGSTGQLSIVTCVMLLFGSIARIFTSIQETGDMLIVCIYALATIGNLVLVSQFIYYGKKSSKKQGSEKSKKAKKMAKKVQ